MIASVSLALRDHALQPLLGLVGAIERIEIDCHLNFGIALTAMSSLEPAHKP